MRKYIKHNSRNITLLIAIYIISIVIGFIVYAFLSQDIKLEMMTQVSDSVNLVKNEGFKSINIIKNGLQNNTIILLILSISSFTVITFFIISAVFVSKAIALSFYICMLFSVFGPLKGILAALIIAIIPNIICIVSYIFLANECHLSSFEILTKITQKSVFKVLVKNILTSLCTLPFIILSTWLEQIFFRLLI